MYHLRLSQSQWSINLKNIYDRYTDRSIVYTSSSLLIMDNAKLGLRMLYAPDKAQILGLLTSKTKNYKHLHKPDKLYLGIPNLMHVLCPHVDKGNERETFFHSQFRVTNEIKYPKQGDFLVDDRCLFEVGGSKKTFDQLADIPDSFLAVDDTEVGHGNRIPLWMFGMLY